MRPLRRNQTQDATLGRASAHGGGSSDDDEEEPAYAGPPRWVMLACLAGSFMLTECIFRYFVFGEQC